MRIKRLFYLVLGMAAGVVGILPLFLPVPAGLPAEADAIVVLGGGSGDRVARSLELLEAGYAAQLVLTGADRPDAGGAQDIQDARTDFLLRNDVRPDRIHYVFPSSNSWQEANSTLELMRSRGWRRVIVVSDPPHMLRLSYTWRRAFQSHPQSFILVATEPAWWNPFLWWTNQASFTFVTSELMKLGYYLVKY